MSESAAPEWKGFVMLNISSSQPVSWSTSPPAPTVVPVGAVPSVGAVLSSAREGQADSGRNGQGSPRGAAVPVTRNGGDGKSSTVQAAPLLPREHAEENASSSPASQVDEARQRAEVQKEEDQKAREKAEQKLQLQEVLASVWKASAAVVDVVLGRESEARAAAEVAAASDVQAVDVTVAGVDPTVPPVRRELEPVAYTVQGASSWAPLEAGQLVNQRV